MAPVGESEQLPPVHENMNRTNSSEQSQSIGENTATEAAIAFTNRMDGSRHRFRFLYLDEQSGMCRLHEIKESRNWRIVGCEPVQQLRISRAEYHPDHPEQRLIE